MKSQSPLLTAALVSALPLAAAAQEKFTSTQLDFFEKNIRPVLAAKCFECHSEKAKIKGGLSLDSRDSILKGGSSGPAAVPGNPEKSLLVRAIKGLEKDMEMPPKEENRLDDEQIASFENWVRMGLPDPRRPGTGGALAVDWDKARQHWAFQPITTPTPPKVKDRSGWARSDLDKFVLARLEAKRMHPNPIVDRRALIRRASYTLLGLPPELKEVNDFVNDPLPNAFARVVDQYLDSPHYGERWARHWMDVARYADTTGDRANRRQPRYPYSWTYRDWLIEAFNNDLPYDQFIKQQIAADRLKLGEDLSPLAALGFLTVGKRFMGNNNELIDDRIDAVTQGFMGLTVACARCHDHKFDPVPTKDYYSLHGVFSSTIEPEPGPIIQLPKDKAAYESYLKEVEELEAEVAQVRGREEDRTLSQFRLQVDKYLTVIHEYQSGPAKKAKGGATQFIRGKGLDQDIFPQWLDYLKQSARQRDPVFTPWFAFTALAKGEFTAKAPALAREIAAGKLDGKPVNAFIAREFAKEPKSIADVAAAYGRAFSAAEKAWKAALKTDAETTTLPGAQEQVRQVLYADDGPFKLSRQGYQRLIGVRIRNAENAIKGRIADLEASHEGSPVRAMAVQDAERARDSFVFIRGEQNNRGPIAPRQFLQILSGENRQPFPRDTSGRLELAEHIASRDNPLTARVLVNRVWQWHFGQALVRTPGDFGLRSEPPTHPGLLDWLAAKFMDGGWSIKKLHRMILLSSTWQQDSLRNAEFEESDPDNTLLWRQNIQRLDIESLRDSLLVYGGKADLTVGGRSLDLSDEGRHRRTLYAEVDRSRIPELYRVFDFANPDMSQAQRHDTTVPQQALFLMNSPFANEEVRNILARPEMISEGTDAEKVTFLFGLLYQREPAPAELKIALEFLETQRQQRLQGPTHQAWDIGYGTLADGRVTGFAPMPEVTGGAMYLRAKNVSREALRDRKARPYEVGISATGGQFAHGTQRAIVQRWTAPADGEISVKSDFRGYNADGAALVARIHSTRQGRLAEWKGTDKTEAANIDRVQVKQGEVLEFSVTPTKPVTQANYRWAPVIQMGGKTWDWEQDFAAATRQSRSGSKPLNDWERFTQVLVFGNELIYLN